MPYGTGQPLVSVVVPTYNYGRFIGETLDSLRAQTYPDWECVVVDDGSTDDTEEIVARVAAADPRVRYLRQRNRRQAVAKNKGLADARGVYVQFLDADDLLEPRKFERQVEYLERHPEVDLVYGDMLYFDADDPSRRTRRLEAEAGGAWMPEVSGRGSEVLVPLLRNNIMVINSPLLRRGVVADVGPFDERLPPVEDWDYWIRCAIAGKRFRFVEQEGTLALVRSHPGSSSRDNARMYGAMSLMRRKLEALLPDGELRRLNREMHAAERGAFGIEQVRGGRPLKAVGSFVRAAAAGRGLKWRVRWAACALAAPFVSESQIRALSAASPLHAVAGAGRGKSRRV
ncbi:MAG TPA: glycosyltransferase [Pyrinomonadaceae bacterium]